MTQVVSVEPVLAKYRLPFAECAVQPVPTIARYTTLALCQYLGMGITYLYVVLELVGLVPLSHVGEPVEVVFSTVCSCRSRPDRSLGHWRHRGHVCGAVHRADC
jgi:hypothetical protein